MSEVDFALLSSTGPLVAILDRDDRIVLWNHACTETTGFSFEEVQGRRAWEFLNPPEEIDRVKRSLADIRTGGRPGQHDSTLTTKSGDCRWIAWSAYLTRTPDGAPQFVFMVGIDRTLAQRAENALRASEEKFERIVSIAADAIISIDEQQRIIVYNDGAERIFGWSRAEVLGKPLDVLLPERFREVHRQHIRNFAAGPSNARKMGERRPAIFGLRKNGEEFPAEAAISRVNTGEGKLFTVVLRDVTARVQTERTNQFLSEVSSVLAETLDYEETLTRITELAVRFLADFCVIDVVGLDGRIRRLRVVHRDPDKALLAATFRDAPLDRSRPHLVKEVFDTHRPMLMSRVPAEAVESLSQTPTHLEILRALNLESLIAVPLIAHGQFLGALVLISSDPQHRYGADDLRLGEELARRAAMAVHNARLYEEAHEAIKAREEVLGIVAHDLRSPLNAAQLAARLLIRKLPEQCERDSISKSVDTISRSIQRANRLIEDLLDVAQIDARKLRVEQERTSCRELLGEVAEIFTSPAAEHSLELQTRCSEELPAVLADKGRVLQVFSNLIGNAMKFTPASGRIVVAAEACDGSVCFSVSDTGPGIPPEQLPLLFTRYWQAKRGDRRGAGLGLTICRGIIEAHGGQIWAESTPGRGTTLTFTLAVAPVAAEEAFPEAHAPQ